MSRAAEHRPPMIPLAHDFTGERVLVVGGGSVGARKARHFAVEADVVVVSPAFADADFAGAERIRASPTPETIAEWVDRVDPALVVAATDDAALNDAAAAAAREAGVLVNRADRSASVPDEAGADENAVETGERPVHDVAVPATVRDEPVVVSISTGGTSPALARELRRRVEGEIEGAGDVARVTGELRRRLREAGVGAEIRKNAIRAAVESPEQWTDLRSGDANVDQITESLMAEYAEDT